MQKRKSSRQQIKNDELILPGGKRVKVGIHAVPISGGNASMNEVIHMLKNAAKKGIFPPPPDLA